MGTTIRAELSKKNPYWLEKHRYYELKHFCQQYPIWKQAYNSLGGLSSRQADLAMCSNKYNMSNPTERIAIIRSFYSERMGMIEKTAKETDLSLAEYIVIGVTEGYEKVLEVNGVGYRAQKQGKKLVLSLGYSHPMLQTFLLAA